MIIRWHGHSCFGFSDSNTRVVIDPHDGKSIGIKAPAATADVVLMSHDHYDHNAAYVIKGSHKDYKGYSGKFKCHGIEFEGIPTFHDEKNGEVRGPNTMYLFHMDGMSVCHCGDLGCIPDEKALAKIHNVDFLLVPVGEVFTLELPKVRQFLEAVNPNVIIPMHYRVGGLTIPVQSIDRFLEMIPDEAVDYVGNEIDVSNEDIGGQKECWIFDR